MTAEAALYSFFNSFNIPGYPSTDLSEKSFPYLTYDAPVSFLDDGETSCTVNLWYKTDSEATPNAKAREIADAIGRGGKTLECDGGYLWVKRGSPWCQSMNDETDTSIKRRYINITLEFMR